jgi:hypothetical protein
LGEATAGLKYANEYGAYIAGKITILNKDLDKNVAETAVLVRATRGEVHKVSRADLEMASERSVMAEFVGVRMSTRQVFCTRLL